MLDTSDLFGVPQELRDVTMRHRRHLSELIERLLIAGMNEDLIQHSVEQLIVSYRAELLDAVKRLGVFCSA